MTLTDLLGLLCMRDRLIFLTSHKIHDRKNLYTKRDSIPQSQQKIYTYERVILEQEQEQEQGLFSVDKHLHYETCLPGFFRASREKQ